MKQRQKTIFDRIGDHLVKHSRQLAFAGAFVAAVGAGLSGYSWYKNHTSRQGHKAYAKAAALLNARVINKGDQKGLLETTFTSEAEKWQAVADAFGKVYSMYARTGIGEMAGAAHVNALLKIGKRDEARAVLSKLATHISSPQLRQLYSVTYALTLLDSAQEDDVENGLSMLKKIARNTSSPVQDSALYHLGDYYWYKDDTANVLNYWKQLMLSFDKGGQNVSPWVAKAKERLALIEPAQD